MGCVDEMLQHPLPCKKCGNPMSAIRNYSIREVCEPCGGKPLVQYERAKERLFDEVG